MKYNKTICNKYKNVDINNDKNTTNISALSYYSVNIQSKSIFVYYLTVSKYINSLKLYYTNKKNSYLTFKFLFK